MPGRPVHRGGPCAAQIHRTGHGFADRNGTLAAWAIRMMKASARRRTVGRSDPRDVGRRRSRQAKGALQTPSAPRARSSPGGMPGRPPSLLSTPSRPATRRHLDTPSRLLATRHLDMPSRLATRRLSTPSRPPTRRHPNTPSRLATRRLSTPSRPATPRHPNTPSQLNTDSRLDTPTRLDTPSQPQAVSRPRAPRPREAPSHRPAPSHLEAVSRPRAASLRQAPSPRETAERATPAMAARQSRNAIQVPPIGPQAVASARRGTRPRRTNRPPQVGAPWPRPLAPGMPSGGARSAGRSVRSKVAVVSELALPEISRERADPCGGWGRSGRRARRAGGRCGDSRRRRGLRIRSTRPGNSPPGTHRPCARPDLGGVQKQVRGPTLPRNRGTPCSPSAILPPI
jgi:hypothetical protein